jgi:tetratricopeptide (TPR) repeat protein
MRSICIRSVFGSFLFSIIATAGSSAACIQPSNRVADLRVPRAYAWFDAGLLELRGDDHYSCIERDFEVATRLFRIELAKNSGIDARDLRLRLVASLSYEGLAQSRLGGRRAAAATWAQAIVLHRKIWDSPLVYFTAEGDRLLERGSPRAAFREYENAIFNVNGVGQTYLTVWELQSGAAQVIRRGLQEAIDGKFAQAAATFKMSPLSPAAYYLEGQAASAAGDHVMAYHAYMDAIAAQPKMGAETGGSGVIGAFSYPSWVRLVNLAKWHA